MSTPTIPTDDELAALEADDPLANLQCEIQALVRDIRTSLDNLADDVGNLTREPGLRRVRDELHDAACTIENAHDTVLELLD